MAGAKVPAPLDPMVNGDDWTNILARYNRTVKGSEGVSLTNWVAGNTDRPEIAAGSVIEIDGSPFYYATDETIVDGGGLTDGWCYIKHVVSGSSVTPTLVNTFGTWDTAKQGFYAGGDRYSLHAMYRSGAVIKIFTMKSILLSNIGELTVYKLVDGNIYQKWGYDGLLSKPPGSDGTTVMIRNDTEIYNDVPKSWLTIRSFTISGFMPVFNTHLTFLAKTYNAPARSYSYRVLVNSTSVYSTSFNGDPSYRTIKTGSFDITGGDIVSIQGAVPSLSGGITNEMYVANARFYYDNSFTPTDKEKLLFGITL